MQYKAVFAGRTKQATEIIIFQDALGGYHIERPDGELIAVPPGSEISTTWSELYDTVKLILVMGNIRIEASGTRRDLIEVRNRGGQ